MAHGKHYAGRSARFRAAADMRTSSSDDESGVARTLRLVDCRAVTDMEQPPYATTIVHAPRLGERLGLDVTVVSETFQETGSFKFRAAWNVVNAVEQELLLTASSGNFGQALARACQLAGKRAIVVMPSGVPGIKRQAVVDYGAEADIFDPRENSRAGRLAEVAAAHPDGYVASPYDDPLIIVGNASLGREIARRLPECDAVVVPVGGGGLASGILTGLREEGSRAAVWGAEPLLANDAARSLRSGRIEHTEGEPATLADGARTPSLGEHNWAILEDGLAGIVEVPEEAIADGLRRLFLDANLKAEPTGALPVGALLTEPDRFRDQRVAVVVSGGNVDPDLYARLIRE